MKLTRTSGAAGTRAIPTPGERSVLLLVHLQNDFCRNGAVPVAEADHVIPVANAWIRFFAGRGYGVVATRDWHPPNHCSFQEQGGSWPRHCVQGSLGAQLHPDLRLPPGTLIVSCATNPNKEADSGFDGTSLQDRLEDVEADTVYVMGFATDSCVKWTVLDARRLGFRVVVVQDGVRGFNVQPGDTQRAVHAMQAAGATLARSADLGIQPESGAGQTPSRTG